MALCSRDLRLGGSSLDKRGRSALGTISRGMATGRASGLGSSSSCSNTFFFVRKDLARSRADAVPTPLNDEDDADPTGGLGARPDDPGEGIGGNGRWRDVATLVSRCAQPCIENRSAGRRVWEGGIRLLPCSWFSFLVASLPRLPLPSFLPLLPFCRMTC